MRISDWSSDACSSDLPSEDAHREGVDPGEPGEAHVLFPDGVLRPDPLVGVVVPAVQEVGDALDDGRVAGGVAANEIGRAAWRESVGTYVSISVVDGPLKTKRQTIARYYILTIH